MSFWTTYFEVLFFLSVESPITQCCHCPQHCCFTQIITQMSLLKGTSPGAGQTFHQGLISAFFLFLNYFPARLSFAPLGWDFFLQMFLLLAVWHVPCLCCLVSALGMSVFAAGAGPGCWGCSWLCPLLSRICSRVCQMCQASALCGFLSPFSSVLLQRRQDSLRAVCAALVLLRGRCCHRGGVKSSAGPAALGGAEEARLEETPTGTSVAWGFVHLSSAAFNGITSNSSRFSPFLHFDNRIKDYLWSTRLKMRRTLLQEHLICISKNIFLQFLVAVPVTDFRFYAYKNKKSSSRLLFFHWSGIELASLKEKKTGMVSSLQEVPFKRCWFLILGRLGALPTGNEQ